MVKTAFFAMGISVSVLNIEILMTCNVGNWFNSGYHLAGISFAWCAGYVVNLMFFKGF